ncbi:MAG: DegQ family serine endoprotease [Ahrensia sp.]|nr:DegQ family serine endoprotease [Ahrensia sp.]
MIRLSAFLVALTAMLAAASAQGTSGLRGAVNGDRVVPQNRTQVQFSYAPLVQQVSPSVVNVYAARQVQQRRSPFAGDPFFERFFGDNVFGDRSRQRQARSLGSGVIIHSDGIVITNHHVIENADEVKVALADGREFSAQIKLIDKQSDLAVLQIEESQNFTAVPLGDSDDLLVGDLVLAIGNPFGVGQTVTSGIVSALARSQTGITDFGFFIQTDASINPGNSGGALVAMDGSLIGINTAIFSRSGGSNGIGFAVPSNMVRVVLDSVLRGSETLMRPWIGAEFQSVTSDIAESLGLPQPVGALVAGVISGSPAEQAGLRLGDVILQLDGRPIEHVDALGYRLATAGLGREIDVTVLTRGEERSLRLSLMEAPETPPRDMRIVGGRSPFTGATVANLSPRVAQELGMRGATVGVVVLGVDARSPARRFGFRRKDIIRSVNDFEIESTAQLDDVARSRPGGWRYEFERDGRRYRQAVR